MKEKKLQTKDLVMAGAFAVLYVGIMMILATVLAFIPGLILLTPLVAGIILGPVYHLYLSKVPKNGAVLILALLTGLTMITSSIFVLVYLLVLGVIAQIILIRTDYSAKGIAASYYVMAMDGIGPLVMIYIGKQALLESFASYYGEAYAEKMDKLTPTWSLLVLFALALAGAFIGNRLGAKMNAKHFRKAGVA
ncbi:MAG: MptD family putative ECF transporter S component [Lachnospiraceae bacterium]|nr:MptD family putative ECF transporter S component [Lachnospiraceae bacterium]